MNNPACGVPLYQVDAFTNAPFSGNPAGVCLLERYPEDPWLRAVAAEMNLSETTFVCPTSEELVYDLRWFTPSVEVDLCGHATLASAHILWEAGFAPKGRPIGFNTRSGRLTAEQRGAWITLDFPAERALPVQPPEGFIEAIGKPVRFTGENRFDLLVELLNEDDVRSLDPDFTALSRFDVRGIIVTARSDRAAACDFVSRFFAPRVGVPEDPVTGSAHCCLGPYWAAVLRKERLVGYQASRRGGIVQVHCKGDRVHLSGQAVTVLTGKLINPDASQDLEILPN